MTEKINWQNESERSFVRHAIDNLVRRAGPSAMKKFNPVEVSVELKICGVEVQLLPMLTRMERQFEKAVEARVERALRGDVYKPIREAKEWIDIFNNELQRKSVKLYHDSNAGKEPWWLEGKEGDDS